MPGPTPPPWWLLPNLAALDAPAVAAVWQRFLAARFGLAVPWKATAALAAAVWAVYLADRWLDARRGERGTDRHRAADRFPRVFAAGFVAAAGVAGVAASGLPPAYLRTGAAVGLGVAGYLALAHAAAGPLGRAAGAKEFLVGVGFAAGVGVPLLAAGPGGRPGLPAVAAFGAACWLNCRLIARWEAAGPPASPADAAVGLATLAAAATLPPAVGLAVGGAVAGLLAVHVTCRRCPRAARALADAALLTPLPCWFLP